MKLNLNHIFLLLMLSCGNSSNNGASSPKRITRVDPINHPIITNPKVNDIPAPKAGLYDDVADFLSARYKKFAQYRNNNNSNWDSEIDVLNYLPVLIDKDGNFLDYKLEDALNKSEFLDNLFLIHWLGNDAEKVLEVVIKKEVFISPNVEAPTEKTVDPIQVASDYINNNMDSIINAWGTQLIDGYYSNVFEVWFSALKPTMNQFQHLSPDAAEKAYNQTKTKYRIKDTHGAWSTYITTTIYEAKKRFILDILLNGLIKDTHNFYIQYNQWGYAHGDEKQRAEKTLKKTLSAIGQLDDKKLQNDHLNRLMQHLLDSSVYSSCPFTVTGAVEKILSDVQSVDASGIVSSSLYNLRKSIVLNALRDEATTIYDQSAIEEILSGEFNLKDKLLPSYSNSNEYNNLDIYKSRRDMQKYYVYGSKGKVLSHMKEVIRHSISAFDKMIIEMDLPISILDAGMAAHTFGDITKDDSQDSFTYSDSLISAILIKEGHLQFKPSSTSENF